MPRKKNLRPKLPELWTPTEVAEYLGIRQQNVKRTKGMPEPALKSKPRGEMYYAAEIKEYAKNRTEPTSKGDQV